MQINKNFLMAAAGAVAMTGALALISPRRSEAQFASPVRIANTGAAPGLVSSVDDPGRTAYQSIVSNVGKCSGTICTFFFPTVPAGHRVVVQHIGGIVDFNAVPTNISVLIEGGAGGFITEFFAPIPTGFLFSVFDQPVLFYIDQNQSAEVAVFITGNGTSFSGDSTSQFVTLTGYELDCTVAPCAAIAH